MLNTELLDLITENNVCIGIKTNKGDILADKVIIATGGKSYPSTGSDGKAFNILQNHGIKITKLKPGLVPLKSDDQMCKKLQGLTLKNVSLKIIDNNKIIYNGFGEMLFAHFGITGPIVLSASSVLNRLEDVENKIYEHKIKASIDLKPALSEEILDKRIQRDFQKYSNKEFKNSLDDLLPQKLIPVIVSKSNIDENKKVHQITKQEREKVISRLFIVGEALDVDALTGGFNLQIAFSTAVAAGKNN